MNLSNKDFKTDRLKVRSCQIADALSLANLMEPSISRWVAVWPFPITVEQVERMLTANLEAAKAGEMFPAVIIENSSQTIVGWLKIEIAETGRRTGELGYWIGTAFQRQGYAHEVARGAIDFAFDELHADAVIAGAQNGNVASLNLFRKLGMTPTGKKDVWGPSRQRSEPCEYWILERGPR
jgi:RimJ/RimL family protein N-acetyltransferase